METDRPEVHQTDDNSIRDNAAPVIVIKNEQPKESPWKQPAIYVAISGVVVCAILIVFFEWQRWVALEATKRDFAQQLQNAKVEFAQKLVDARDKQHDYYEEINVWETDHFNREKDIDSWARANLHVDFVKLFGKPNPPPIPKEN